MVRTELGQVLTVARPAATSFAEYRPVVRGVAVFGQSRCPPCPPPASCRSPRFYFSRRIPPFSPGRGRGG